MLKALKIENIAIIEYADIDFSDGLNVLSGETGAGKSIIIDALSAVLGERTSKELIRTGAPFARVTAEFENVSEEVKTVAAELGATIEQGENLIVTRTINADGKNNCRINGAPVNVSMLKTLGRELISIHGQHDSQNLLNPEMHFVYLDLLGDYENLIEDYKAKYEEYVTLYRRFKSLVTNEEELRRKTDFLQYEINEIESLGLQPGEIKELRDRREFFKNADKVRNGLKTALAALDDGDDTNGAVTMLFNAAHALNTPAQHVKSVDDTLQALNDAAFTIQSLRNDVANALYDCDFDESEREATEDRLAEIKKIQMKYGESEEEIFEYLAKQKEELSFIEISTSDREHLEEILEEKKGTLLAAAEALSKARRAEAHEFEQKVSDELKFLNMPNVVLETSFERCKLNPTGCDVIEFLISPNPGESPKPLSKIASGGELSRIMLAIQNVLSSKGNVATMIFDEIDTGVSGSAAEKIARKLSQVSDSHQVLCITHSPQVAAYADNHFLISKEVRGGKTYTNVTPLNEEGRANELARIIGGEQITELAVKTAEEMLEMAKNVRNTAI